MNTINTISQILAIIFLLSLVPFIYALGSKDKRNKTLDLLGKVRKVSREEIDKYKELTSENENMKPRIDSIEGSLLLYFKKTGFSWPTLQAISILNRCDLDEIISTVKTIIVKKAKMKLISHDAVKNAVEAALKLFKGVHWIIEDEEKGEYQLSRLGERLHDKVQRYYGFVDEVLTLNGGYSSSLTDSQSTAEY